MRAGRGMMLYSKATSDPPPQKLELFSYENNQVIESSDKSYLGSDSVESKYITNHGHPPLEHPPKK